MGNYTIKSTNPSNAPIIVQDQQINKDTNLTFVGKNYFGYGPIIAEDFLHLLENFANAVPPEELSSVGGDPLEGQLWYNKGTQQLNVFDGTRWNPVGSIKKSSTAPTVAIKGDIWVDVANYQLYVYSGTTWLLVGPEYSAGSKTGAQVLQLVDVTDSLHNVTAIYSDTVLISIISNIAFVPKSNIPGFSSINRGINLNSNTDNPTKLWGIATEADSLNINGTTVSSGNFLRSDIISTTNNPLRIRADGGISLGGDLSFNISTSTSAVIFNSNASGKGVNFLLKNSAGLPQTALYLNADSKVGIGPNNTTPLTALDVKGIITVHDDTTNVPTISGQVVVNGTSDIFTNTLLNVSNASIYTAGGISATKGMFVGGRSIFNNSITISNIQNQLPVAGSVLLPGIVDTYDIGSTTKSFRNIYASNFGKSDNTSTFSGSFTGTFNGDINGSASSLSVATLFRLAGDVSSDVITFTGIGGTATFTTGLDTTCISSKTEATDTRSTDYFLVSRTFTDPVTNSTSTVLRKTTKATIVSNLPLVPIGAIFPYAGGTPPTGYLLCDGSEVSISKYSALFQVVQFSFKASSLLLGYNTFALPDLRGRFPLGADNMNNHLTVPSKGSTNIQISAGGGSANRVTDVTADNLGAGSGIEKQTLLTSNLPEHVHSMSSGNNQYYAVGAPNITDTLAISGYGLSSTSNSGYGYQYSGPVVSDRLSQPVNVMNPYTTINYIIYTGVTS